LAGTTGAKLAWVPRRAGERGALETGCLPNLLPGGRPVADAAARVDLGAVWGSTVPVHDGRDGNAIIAAAAAGDLQALVVGGVDPVDLPDRAAVGAALRSAFVVSLEVRAGAVTELADVVLPVAPVAEKDGMFVNWEGRVRPFDRVLRDTRALPDLRVLAGIADELRVDLGFRTPAQARAEMREIGAWDGARVAAPRVPTAPLRDASSLGSSGQALRDASSLGSSGQATTRETVREGLRLATWKLLIDDGRMLDGDDYLKATGRKPIALVSAGTLAGLGLPRGALVTLHGEHGSVTLPLAVADLPDGVVWAPTSSAWSAPSGSAVRLEGAGA
jgi:NADH-quinone oxidoreductase subunit G